MSVTYNDKIKNLPCEQLEKLFVSAGWSDSKNTHDNSWFKISFTNSTLAIRGAKAQIGGAYLRDVNDKITLESQIRKPTDVLSTYPSSRTILCL